MTLRQEGREAKPTPVVLPQGDIDVRGLESGLERVSRKD
jgi:hypothetical protein